MTPPPAELVALQRHLDHQSSTDASPIVDEFVKRSARTEGGLFGFACDQTGQHVSLATLNDFDQQMHPRVPLNAAFATMAATFCPHDVDLDAYLSRLVSPAAGDHLLASGDDEVRAFAAAHFGQVGLHAVPDDVHVFDGGTETVLDAVLRSAMWRHGGENYMIAEIGLERSVRCPPGLGGGASVVYEDLTDDVLDEWLADWAHKNQMTVLYVPLVNRLTGSALTRERAHSIAERVMRFNLGRPNRPVLVVADDSAIGSHHGTDSPEPMCPIGTVTGEQVGDRRLGRMSDWTLSVVTPGPVFGVRNPQVSFAVTGNMRLRRGMALSSKPNGFAGRCLNFEQTAAAALCLTPSAWIRTCNERAAGNLHELRRAIHAINSAVGFDALSMSKRTAAGRHTAVQLHPRLYQMPDMAVVDDLSSTEHRYRNLFEWHHDDPERDTAPRLALRVSLMASPEEHLDMITRLTHVVTNLAASDC